MPTAEYTLDQESRGALARGEEDAWTDFLAWADPIVRSVLQWPKWHFTPDTRNDLQQLIRTELVKSIDRVDHDSRLRPFVKRVCVNRCIDEVRRQVRERRTFVALTPHGPDDDRPPPEPPADASFDPVRTIVRMERAALLRELIDNLSDTCREAIADFYLHELTYREMSKRHNIAVNTVGSRLAKCLGKLRVLANEKPELLEGLAGEDPARAVRRIGTEA